MSLNCVMLTQDGRSSVPLPQEKMFFSQDNVKLVLDCNEGRGDYPGNSSGYWEVDKGTIILSNQRIIYIATRPNDKFQTLNVPILNFKNWKLEQPWFGANFIVGMVMPVFNGGLPKAAQLKATFSEGGAIEFTNILRSLLERIGEANEIPKEYEALPAYEGSSSSSYPTNAAYPPPPSTTTYPPPPSNTTYPPPPPSNTTYPPPPPPPNSAPLNNYAGYPPPPSNGAYPPPPSTGAYPPPPSNGAYPPSNAAYPPPPNPPPANYPPPNNDLPPNYVP